MIFSQRHQLARLFQWYGWSNGPLTVDMVNSHSGVAAARISRITLTLTTITVRTMLKFYWLGLQFRFFSQGLSGG